MNHLNIRIYGTVQGVFFRANAKEQAEKLGLSGFVKNLPDGSVYIEAEGKKEKLDEFVKWCGKGPSTAIVEKIEVFPGKNKGIKEFFLS